ncbi:pseudouridine synthase [Primorskyibacter sp. S87]|uniref:pseudouridine synthase n=1 Tax=Primorskyibacter sp. S87 TaxID=3415126 RepID=UPI003C79F7BD
MSKPTPPGDRIAKVLARAGIASRREAERMIEAGRVTVNGRAIDSPALNVTEQDRIAVDGKLVDPPEPPRMWLYHKPPGLVTTHKDEQGRKTIFDALPEDMPRVMSVGRLDLNSEGLLILTNDGGIKRKLELPSTGWLRRYRVRINGRPDDSAFDPLRKGLVIGAEAFQPMTVTLDRQQGANAWLTVGLREGKNREIRRAMEDIGFAVNRLIRVSYGPFQLGQLKSGEIEELRAKLVRDQLGLTRDDMTGAEPEHRPTPQRNRGKAGSKPGSDPRKKTSPSREHARNRKPTTKGGTGQKPARGPKPRGKPGN